MKVLERDIENALGRYAKKLGCIYYKFTSPARRSVPDRMVIGPHGEIVFIELKAPGKKPTPLQLREIKLLQSQGCSAEWVDNVDDGKALIDSVCTLQ